MLTITHLCIKKKQSQLQNFKTPPNYLPNVATGSE